MKNQKFNLLSIVCVLFLGMSFVSCSDDEDEGGVVGPSKVDSFTYKVDYKFNEDLLSIANITMYYINEEGGLSSEVIKSTTWKKNVTTKTLPFIMNTYYTVQQKGEELTKDIYDLAVSRSIEYFASDAEGKMLTYNQIDRKMESLKVKAATVYKYFEKTEGKRNDEFNYSVSLNDTRDGVVVVPVVQ